MAFMKMVNVTKLIFLQVVVNKFDLSMLCVKSFIYKT